jgi:ADP-dependent phosphofructokinase/glucokinase
MTQKEAVLKEIDELPDQLNEILEFVQFLKYKKKHEKFEIAVAAESSLKKDWMKPEEDETWKHLMEGEP